MAITFRTAFGNSTKSSVSSIAATVPAGGVPVGTLVIAITGTGTSGSSPFGMQSNGITDSKSNTWNWCTTSGGSYAKWTVLTTAWVAGDTITGNVASVGDAAIAVVCFDKTGTISYDGGSVQTTTGTTNVLPSGNYTTTQNGILVGAAYINGPNTDTYTEDSNYTSAGAYGTSGQSAGSNVTLRAAYDLSATAGTNTYVATLGTNRALSVASYAFYETIASTPKTGAETPAITITESSSIAATTAKTGTESPAVTITDASSVVVTAQNKAASESEALTITESSAVTVSFSSSESEALTITDASSAPVINTPTPTYQGVATVSTASGVANAVITKSDLGTITNGDLLLAFCCANNTTPTWSSSGWTNFAQDTSVASAFLYRIADGTEGSTITFTRSNATGASEVTVVRISNPNGTTPLDVAGFVGGSGSVILPSITVTQSDALLFQFASRLVSLSGQSWTPPGTATERFDQDAPTNTLRVAGGDESVQSGATGTRTWTQSGTGAVRGGIIAITAPTTGPTLKSASDSGAITIQDVSSKPNLQIFREAIAARETARVNIGILGCSLVEGYPCTADKTIEQYLAQALRGDYPTSGNPTGYGRVPIPTSAMAGINPWTITAGTGGVVGTSDATTGWGANHQSWYTNGSIAVPPILVLNIVNGPWSSADIDILGVVGYSTTAGMYRVDGGSWVNFDLSAPGPVTGLNKKIHINQTINSTIEVTIATGNPGSYVCVNGITGYKGDESKGIEVHNFGHSGFKVSQWRSSVQPGWDFRFDQALEDLDLLVISDLGVNDAQAISSSAFRTNLEDFLNYIFQLHDKLPVVMVGAYDISAGVTYLEPWSNYRDVMLDVCNKRGIPFIDMTQHMPPTPNAIYYTDNAHGNTNGDAYKMFATILAHLLTDMSADTGAITITESSSVAIINNVSASDSGAITITDASSVANLITQISASDSAAITIADSSSPLITMTRTDTGAITITESSSVSGNAPGSETTGLGITDTSQLTVIVSTSESEAISVADSSTSSSTFSRTDTAAITIADASQSALTLSRTDTAAITIADVSSLVITTFVSASESEALTISDASTSSSTLAGSESVAITISESATNGNTNGLSTTDAGAITVTESITMLVSITTGDTGAVTIAETSSVSGTVVASESPAVTITDASAVNPTIGKPGQESIAISIAETSAPLVSISTSDTGAITISDASSPTVTMTRPDTAAVTITESRTLGPTLSRTDTGAITIADASTLVISTAKSASDTAAITITEGRSMQATSTRTDTAAITISEASAVGVTIAKTASDTGAITITSAKILKNLLPNQPNVYFAGEWTVGVFKVYVGGTWQQFPVKHYHNGIWT